MHADATVPGTGRVYEGIARRIAAHELTLGVLVLGLWIGLDLLTPGIALLTMLVRLSVWIGLLRREFAVVHAFEQRDTSSDQELLEVDAALNGGLSRAARSYSLLWVLAGGCWVLLGLAGLLGEDVYTWDLAISGSLLALSHYLGVSIVELLLDDALSETRQRLVAMLAERNQELEREQVSLLSPMRRATLHVVGILFLFGAFVVKAKADDTRVHSVELARAQLAVQAERIKWGEAPGLADAQLLTLEQLPPSLRTQLEQAEQAELPEPGQVPLAVYDPSIDRVLAATPVSEERWLVSTSAVRLDFSPELLSLLLLSAIGLLFVGSGFFLFRRDVERALANLEEPARRFAEHGELRALAQAVPLRNDEFAPLARHFNHMLESLLELERAATRVGSGDLDVELNHPGQLHDAFRAMLDQLNGVISRLRVSTLTLADATVQIDARIEQLQNAVEEQSVSIQKLSETVISLAADGAQIAGSTEGARRDAAASFATTEALIKHIDALQEESSHIRELLELIQDVAERSDLLALNGALEAVRAGELGRGFGIVASEMRRLAERVTSAVAGVRERVVGIEVASSETVQSTLENHRLAERSLDTAREISAVIIRQSNETEQASLGLQRVAEGIMDTNEAMKQMRASVQIVHQQAGELERHLAKFRTTVGESD